MNMELLQHSLLNSIVHNDYYKIHVYAIAENRTELYKLKNIIVCHKNVEKLIER